MSKAGEVKLIVAVRNAKNEHELCRRQFLALRKELDDVETKLIEAKVNLERAQEALEQFRTIHIGETSLDDHRTIQIENYKAILPALLERIKDEKPLETLSILDLLG